MPRSGGVYFLPTIYLAEPGSIIRSEQHNAPLEDIAQALTNSLPRDGQAPMLADLPMNGRRVVNMGDGVNPQDGATVSQVPKVSQWMETVADLEIDTDQIPYATGPYSSDVTDLTEFGRSLIGDEDAEEARSTLGLGTMATRNSGTGASDHRTNSQNDGRFVQHPSSNGIMVRTASESYATRSINVSGALTISNPNGVNGNINLSLPIITLSQATNSGNTTAGAVHGQRLAQVFNAKSVGSPDQSWQNVIGQRNHNTHYTNNTGRPIMVSIGGWRNPLSEFQIRSSAFGGWITVATLPTSSSASAGFQIIVPVGSQYRLERPEGTGAISRWAELR